MLIGTINVLISIFVERKRKMDAKEQLLRRMIEALTGQLGAEDINSIIFKLSGILRDYKVEMSKELPSVEVGNTEKIISMFLATKKVEGCLDSTIGGYRYHIKRFVESVNQPILRVETNTIRCYLGILLSQGKKNSYVDTVRRDLNTFYQWAEDENLVVKNPCKKIKRVKCEKKMEMPYTDMEIAKIRDACIDKRENALISILMSTGIRREEVVKIRLSDINWQNRSIKIYGKGAKQRIVFFSANCQLDLEKYLNERKGVCEHLFISSKAPFDKLTVSTLHKLIKKIGQRAGVKNVRAHRFRAWFGTSMADKGVDIQDLKEMMGHAKIETTNTYYVFANMNRIRSEHQKYAA